MAIPDFRGFVFPATPYGYVQNIAELLQIPTDGIKFEFRIDVEDASGWVENDIEVITSGSSTFKWNWRRQKYEIANKDQIDISEEIEILAQPIELGKVELSSYPNSGKFNSYKVYKEETINGAILKSEVDVKPIIQMINEIPYAVFPDSSYDGMKLNAVYNSQGSILDGVKLDFSNFDSEPVQGSQNPVSSDGLAKYFADKLPPSAVGQSGKTIKSNGLKWVITDFPEGGEVAGTITPSATPILSGLDTVKSGIETTITIDNYISEYATYYISSDIGTVGEILPA